MFKAKLTSLLSIHYMMYAATLLIAVTGCSSSGHDDPFRDWREVSEIHYDSNEINLDNQSTNMSAAKEYIPNIKPLQPDAPLADLLRLAALNNPHLEASFLEWKAALERIPQVRNLPDPRFNYKYFIENIETRVGPQRQAFGISQMFPWFGKLKLKESVAYENAQVAKARYDAIKVKLFYQVKVAYYEYYFLSRRITVVEENLELMKYLENVVRTRFKVVESNHPDVIRAQVELGKLDDQVRSLKDLKTPLLARLNALLNRPMDAPVEWKTPIMDIPSKIDVSSLETMLKNSNPELKTLQHVIAKERESIRLSRKDYYPDITLGLDYIDTDKRSGASPSDNGQDAVAVGFSINLPINKDTYDANVRGSIASFGAALKNREDRENSLSVQLKTAIYHYEDAIRKLDLYRDTLLPKATQSLKATEASFRAGKSSFIDLVDAERVLLEFKLASERAVTDHAIRLAEIEMLVGHLEKHTAEDNTTESSQDKNKGNTDE